MKNKLETDDHQRHLPLNLAICFGLPLESNLSSLVIVFIGVHSSTLALVGWLR